MTNYRPLWWCLLAVNLLAFVAGLLDRPHSLMGKIVLVTSLMNVIVFGLLLSGRLRRIETDRAACGQDRSV